MIKIIKNKTFQLLHLHKLSLITLLSAANTETNNYPSKDKLTQYILHFPSKDRLTQYILHMFVVCFVIIQIEKHN